jgi:hypothetical protein
MKSVYLAVHHAVDIRGLIACAVVFHTAVVEDITADLTAPLYLLLSGLYLGLRLLRFFIARS